MVFGARHSDGKWAREAWQQHIVHKHLMPLESESLRATDCLDLLRARGVWPYDKRMFLNARTGQGR